MRTLGRQYGNSAIQINILEHVRATGSQLGLDYYSTTSYTGNLCSPHLPYFLFAFLNMIIAPIKQHMHPSVAILNSAEALVTDKSPD